MKLGNVSKSIVPVPKFFLEKNSKAANILNSGENYKLNKKSISRQLRNHSYFRDSDIFKSNIDLNINNNPRSLESKTQRDGSNEQKYIPLYDRKIYPRNSEMKHTYFPEIIDSYIIKPEKVPKNGFQKYKQFMSKTNIHQFLKPDLREEIMYNTMNLIDRINAGYDLNRWTDFDCRTTFNRIHQTAYSPLTDVIKCEINDKEQFSQILRDTALGLTTISNKAKDVLERTLSQKEFEEHKNLNMNNNNIGSYESNLDLLLETNKTNLLRLKENNAEPPDYNKKDKEFIEDNKLITKKINIGKLYGEFPSKTRMEFHEKIIYPKKIKFKANDGIGLVDKKNYGFSEKEIYACQDPMWTRPLHKDAFKIDE